MKWFCGDALDEESSTDLNGFQESQGNYNDCRLTLQPAVVSNNSAIVTVIEIFLRVCLVDLALGMSASYALQASPAYMSCQYQR